MNVIDVWAQQPNAHFLSQPYFDSLKKWTGNDFSDVPLDWLLGTMDAAGVRRALLAAWYGPNGPLIPNEEVLELVQAHPDRFAAIAPVCGGGQTSDAERLKTVPTWVFHGTKDRAVPFQRSVDMVSAIKKAGGDKIRFTTMEDIGHNCWSATYATPELYSWFLRQEAGSV